VKKTTIWISLLFGLSFPATPASPADLTADGSDMADCWKEQFDWENTPEPFSFTYGSEPSAKFLKGWRRTSEHKRLDADRTAHEVLYVDPDTGLQIRWQGVKTIVWFEPERVAAETWLASEHPQWVLGGAGGGLLNLGDPKAWNWLIDHIDKLITEEGIDLYRQDYNIDPLGYWRGNDTEDRQGITEIRHVEGYLAYWDELRRRHPGMLIDSCASGGRRNDLETLRRAVPLLRSDWLLEPVSQQAHTFGISFWFPYWGTGVNSSDPYLFRSVMCPAMIACYDVRREDLDYAGIRRLVSQWRSLAPSLMQGDYYPLTGYSLDREHWIGWQFDRPELGHGMVQVFRREQSIYESARLPLRGLEAEAVYEVRDLDQDDATRWQGRELIEKGMPTTISTRPGAVLLMYRKVNGAEE